LQIRTPIAFLLACSLCAAATGHAETGHDAWLRYARLQPAAAEHYRALPAATLALSDTIVLSTAQAELVRGVKGMLGRTLRIAWGVPTENAIIIGTVEQLRNVAPTLRVIENLRGDAFWLTAGEVRGFRCIIITAATDRGVLYGVFALLGRIARQEDIFRLNEFEQPSAPVRWVNQWDNLDGTIERGYAGGSIFFENGSVRPTLARVSEYARLLASVGINGCNVNNVNADPHILDPDFIPQLARIAEAFRPWGVQLGVAVDLSLPKTAGSLDTFDPLDVQVTNWWQKKFDEVYRAIPDFGGVVVKADSEGRPGPSFYGRTPAVAANVIAPGKPSYATAGAACPTFAFNPIASPTAAASTEPIRASAASPVTIPTKISSATTPPTIPNASPATRPTRAQQAPAKQNRVRQQPPTA